MKKAPHLVAPIGPVRSLDAEAITIIQLVAGSQAISSA
jgi:hypothetical protein